ncbi:MAG: hypothetical protein HC837_20035 [Chloroflexaceae bacterium]|nr:hypothetical protein [Chloroflexaceae bacterium]
MLAALCDVERSTALLMRNAGLIPLDTMISGLAWGHIRLEQPAWVLVWRSVALVTFGSAVWWFLRQRTAIDTSTVLALLVLALAMVLVWGNAFVRVLPGISEGVVYPVARYTFPAIIPTMLVVTGGFWVLWPRPWRPIMLLVLIGAVLLLNAISIFTVWSFYQSIAMAALAAATPDLDKLALVAGAICW